MKKIKHLSSDIHTKTVSRIVKSYHINPHIFGFLHDGDPGIYIGIADKDVEFEVSVNGRKLSFNKEFLKDDYGNKTHLSRQGDSLWFRASADNDPNVRLTVKLPEGITVVFDSVPVKPEWME